MTPDQLLTKKDLLDFKQELFALLKNQQVQSPKKWLRNADVKKILGVSPGTLHNLRINGTLPFKKIGSIYYYQQEDIDRMLAAPEKKSSR